MNPLIWTIVILYGGLFLGAIAKTAWERWRENR